jgi:hypothetical protein
MGGQLHEYSNLKLEEYIYIYIYKIGGFYWLVFPLEVSLEFAPHSIKSACVFIRLPSHYNWWLVTERLRKWHWTTLLRHSLRSQSMQTQTWKWQDMHVLHLACILFILPLHDCNRNPKHFSNSQFGLCEVAWRSTKVWATFNLTFQWDPEAGVRFPALSEKK